MKKLTLRNEAAARFGDSLFDETEAERFCVETLAGLKPDHCGFFDDGDVAERFKARPELMPNTLSDCLYERVFWSDLYALRKAAGYDGDQGQEAYARESFALRCLAEIRPRSKEESIAVFRYLAGNDCIGRTETDDILLNLIG